MFERDYLMRLISQSARIVGSILGLREQKKQEEALALIDEFLSRELRLKTRIAMGLSDEDLLAMLTVGGTPNAESVAIIAAMLQEEGELLDDMGRPEDSVPRYAKALRLNAYLLEHYGEVEGWDVSARMERLLGLLAPYEWDAQTTRAVWSWSERTGRLAEAENRLFELWEAGGATADEGDAFYERLGRLADASLEAGGLSREELEEGRRQWRQLAGEMAG